MDINGGLMASAAVLGPVLVYFTSKRGQKDAARQAVAATRITEDKAALDSWKAIAERHEKDRDDARAMEAAARCREDDERAKRRDVEVLLDGAQARIRQLHEENVALRGMVSGGITAAAATMIERPALPTTFDEGLHSITEIGSSGHRDPEDDKLKESNS